MSKANCLQNLPGIVLFAIPDRDDREKMKIRSSLSSRSSTLHDGLSDSTARGAIAVGRLSDVNDKRSRQTPNSLRTSAAINKNGYLTYSNYNFEEQVKNS